MSAIKLVRDAVKGKLRDAEFSLQCHIDQLPEAEAMLMERKEAYEHIKGFPDEVRGWIKQDQEKIVGLKQRLEENV